MGVVPIVNENDTVVTDEIRFGDNDTLGALVTNLIEADALVILTDQRGLYEADPRKYPDARFVSHAQAGDPALEAMAGGAGSGIGTGGMLTKILAAKRAAHSGAHTVIASGRERDAAGAPVARRMHRQRTARGIAGMVGTQAMAGGPPARLRGRVVLDEGAVRALRQAGKSLLPIGVTDVQGDFERGDAVACVDADGHESRARPDQLFGGRHAPHHAPAFVPHRSAARQHDRTGTGAPGQPGRTLGSPDLSCLYAHGPSRPHAPGASGCLPAQPVRLLFLRDIPDPA